MPNNLEDVKDFVGPKELLKIYLDTVKDLDKVYMDGKSICLAGPHGVGKTLTSTSILKKACHKNYLCLYTTLTDIVNILTTYDDEVNAARRELMTIDFLVIDEFDSRYIGTANTADLFGKTLEHILRNRSQNKLPTILCSNSPNPVEAFDGPIKGSIESLMSRVEIIPVFAKDHRVAISQANNKFKELIKDYLIKNKYTLLSYNNDGKNPTISLMDPQSSEPNAQVDIPILKHEIAKIFIETKDRDIVKGIGKWIITLYNDKLDIKSIKQ